MRTVDERIGGDEVMVRAAMSAMCASIRVAIPGIVQSFDSEKQTVTVQPAIREKVLTDEDIEDVQIPLLADVPVCFPRAGGYSLLMTPKKGDECLVVFSDLCIDSWWQSGGIQNQADLRRHDFSDGFAIMGTWSQPNKPDHFPSGGIALQSESTGKGVFIKDGAVTVTGTTITIEGGTVNLKGNVLVNGSPIRTGE